MGEMIIPPLKWNIPIIPSGVGGAERRGMFYSKIIYCLFMI